MSAHEINFVLQVACVTMLVWVCLLLIKYLNKGLHIWTGIGFVLSIICYLVIDTTVVENSRSLYLIMLTLAVCTPVFFFLLSKAIFDDHFKASARVPLWFLLQIIPHAHLYGRNEMKIGDNILQYFYIAAEISSIGFILAALYTAIKTRKGDLIESRLHFRNTFIMITASLIGITLIVESIPLEQTSIEVLQIFQRLAIIALTAFFLLTNFSLREGLFFNEVVIEKAASFPEDKQLRQKLEMLIVDGKIYRKEGLTIRELAELMNDQEYRLRRMINGEMGYKNFNDFLNQYRVNEACEILSDPSQHRKTILEIAYALGYQSIGPFNKAFRELKNTTPTAFRKANQT